MKPRGKLVRVRCACCGKAFSARQADRARGWAQACGKSCAARLRERARAGVPVPRHVPGLDSGPGLSLDGPEFDFDEDLSHGDL